MIIKEEDNDSETLARLAVVYDMPVKEVKTRLALGYLDSLDSNDAESLNIIEDTLTR